MTDDPMLDPLAHNGGLTYTHALRIDSPAINAAPDCTTVVGMAVSVDQRAQPRPGGFICDLGAYEDEGGKPGEPPTETPTPPSIIYDPLKPEVTAVEDAICRYEPAQDSREVNRLLEGQTAIVTGRTPDSTWLEIEGSDWKELCWIVIDLVDFEGDPDELPIKPLRPTFTPTTVPQACTLKALVNLFCRPAPGYEPIDSFVPGDTAEVVAQSEFLWQVIGPNYGKLCTVPKDEKLVSVEGDCEELSDFTPLPPPTATFTPTPTRPAPPDTPVPAPPQCSDGVDNDGDKLIDLNDRECRDANDNDESTP